jgi:hypothetical protein
VGRFVAAALLVCAAGFIGAPQAAADPADLVPYCSGDQTPMDSNCRANPSQVATHPGSGVSPGLPYGGVSPALPYGINPGEDPVI